MPRSKKYLTDEDRENAKKEARKKYYLKNKEQINSKMKVKSKLNYRKIKNAYTELVSILNQLHNLDHVQLKEKLLSINVDSII